MLALSILMGLLTLKSYRIRPNLPVVRPRKESKMEHETSKIPNTATPSLKPRAIVISAFARVRELLDLGVTYKCHSEIFLIISRFDLYRYANDPNFRIDLVTPSMANSVLEELLEMEKRVADILKSVGHELQDPAILSPIISNDDIVKTK